MQLFQRIYDYLYSFIGFLTTRHSYVLLDTTEEQELTLFTFEPQYLN